MGVMEYSRKGCISPQYDFVLANRLAKSLANIGQALGQELLIQRHPSLSPSGSPCWQRQTQKVEPNGVSEAKMERGQGRPQGPQDREMRPPWRTGEVVKPKKNILGKCKAMEE